MNSSISKPKTLVRTARPAFLLFPLVCIVASIATALLAGAEINGTMLALIVVMGLLAHASVNWFNEYHDFKSGLDFNTLRTPFSGGSGGLPERPDAAKWVLAFAVLSLLLVILIGSYFVYQVGLPLLLYGLLGAVVIVLYTGPINRNPFLCLIAPGVGFGLLMMLGAHHVLAGSINSAALFGALIVFILANNLLLLNQFPDIDADKNAGRYHALIAWGVAPSQYIFTINWLLTLAVIMVGIVSGILPMLTALACIGLIPGLVAIIGVLKYGARIGEFPQFMAANVACTLLTPLLFGAGIIVSLYS